MHVTRKNFKRGVRVYIDSPHYEGLGFLACISKYETDDFSVDTKLGLWTMRFSDKYVSFIYEVENEDYPESEF